MVQHKKLAVGVDIGGTNLKIGLVNNLGDLVDFQSLPLERTLDSNADVLFICKAVKRFIEKHGVFNQLAGVCVACPGIIDSEYGIVNYAVNLGWENISLVEKMERFLKLDVILMSDSVAGALGERYYSATGMEDYLFICIGTGVGASFITNGKFYEGDRGKIINLGHISIIHNGQPCNCGNKGCLENYVSATALTERVRNEIDRTDTMLKEYIEVEGGLEAHHIYESAKKGDTYALKLFREAGEILGIAIVNCIQLFNVENIIIGGGVSQAGPYLLEPVCAEVSERLSNKNIKISCSDMPEKSGVLGAASQIFS